MGFMMEEASLPVALLVSGIVVLLGTYKIYQATVERKKVPSGTNGAAVKEDKPDLYFFFGSQTGTAEGFCNTLSEHFTESMKLKCKVVDLEDWDEDSHDTWLEAIKRKSVMSVFLVATYGEGDPTDNARNFMTIMKDSRDGDLEGVHYAVFGLGNTEYEFYNRAGKSLDSVMSKGGGSRVAKLALGDDNVNLEEDFESWKDDALSKAAKTFFNLTGEEKSSAGDVVAIENAIKVVKDKQFNDPQPSTSYFWESKSCKVTKNVELLADTANGAMSTKHVEVSLSNGLEYVTADNAAVLPTNDDKVVKLVLDKIGANSSDVFNLSCPDGREPFPTPCTVQDCLAKYCDLTTPPRRSELKALSRYCPAGLTKDALVRLSSKDGKSEYEDKIRKPYVGWGNVIAVLCKDVPLTLEDVINLTPRMKPRYYTISSSSSVHPKSMHLTVAVTRGKNESTNDGYEGLCSGHISKSGDSLDVFVKESSFRLPKGTDPIIMVGPGTGFAPMRALIQERVSTRATGQNVLFFGCRRSNEDFIYADEINEWEKGGVVTVYKAFSREQKEKVYVQHLISKQKEMISSLLGSQNATLYICGGTRMGKDVVETVREILGDLKWFKVQDEGRIVQELWG